MALKKDNKPHKHDDSIFFARFQRLDINTRIIQNRNL